MTVSLDGITAQITELEEEHNGDDAAFSGFDKINKAGVTDRLREIKGDPDALDEADVLSRWLKLAKEEADLKKQLRDAEAALDAKALAQYPQLNEADTQALVVNDKWLATLAAAIHGEMDRLSQALTQRVKELTDRYDTPMPQMVSRLEKLESKVNQHLEKMGFVWK